MCGRYILTADRERMALLGLPEPFAELKITPRYNIAPTQQVLTYMRLADGDRWAMARWGLLPLWAKDKKMAPLINARADTIVEKPAFRTALKQRRCLIPADGFYEWQKTADGKQPNLFQLRTGDPFVFAGLWESWEGDDGPVLSCTLITTDPNELVAPVHDRMPVILPRDAYDAWLDPKQHDPAQLQPMLRPYPAELMVARPVSKAVNTVSNDGPELLEAP